VTETQFDTFLSNHTDLEHTLSPDEKAMLFRDCSITWYGKDNSRFTKIEKKKFNKMTPEDLEDAIYRGLKVEQITRVTGYFTKVSQWNPGKTAELKDRKRCGDNFNTIETPQT